MSRRPFKAREVTLKVSALLNEKRFGRARQLLRENLAIGSSLTKREQKILLSNLTRVELMAGKPHAALKMLERRHALGVSHWNEKLGEIFVPVTLLARSGEWIAARAELIRLLTNRKCLGWNGLLGALEFYFDLEVECKKYLESRIESACKAAVQRNQIPISTESGASIEETVRAARALYRTSSKNYQELLLRVYSASNQDERAAVIRDLRTYVSSEKIGFFKNEGRKLLVRIAARRGARVK